MPSLGIIQSPRVCAVSAPYSNIVCDIDGTIIPLGTSGLEHITCSDRTVRAVGMATANGWQVSIATGRKRTSALQVHQQVGANGDLICYQGAMIVDARSNEVLVHERIDEDVAAAAIEYFMSQELEVRVYLDDTIYLKPSGDDSQAVARRPSSNYKLTSDLIPLAKMQPTTIVGVDRPSGVPTHVDAVGRLLGDSALVTRSLSHFCEIGSPRAGKVKALEWLAEHRGLDCQATVAFGDGMGDIEMLKWASLGIAVGTDIPEVLEVACESVEGPTEDGVAKKIEKLVAA